jgi:acyl-coenzyme A thioesterase PaaI-like protein
MTPEWFTRCPPRWQARLMQFGFNWHPAYRASGARVTHVAGDLTLVRVRLPFNRRTRNVVGSLFGGALFSATDGPHPTLLMLGLGPDYIVWDKAASIQFKKPGRTTLYADCVVSKQELDAIRQILRQQPEADRSYTIELKDQQGTVYAVVERVVYVARKDFYKRKVSAMAGAQ